MIIKSLQGPLKKHMYIAIFITSRDNRKLNRRYICIYQTNDDIIMIGIKFRIV